MLRGRPIVSTTTYDYDTEGRVSLTTTTEAPAWLDSDRWLALAAQRVDDEKCAGCGEPRSLAWQMDPDSYYDAVVYECQACAVVQEKSHGTDLNSGSYVSARYVSRSE